MPQKLYNAVSYSSYEIGLLLTAEFRMNLGRCVIDLKVSAVRFLRHTCLPIRLSF